ncbi:MAG: hypothetical protein R3242_00450 [Akkermansiaceae bacterium]|nr:hypothetical protein [Akkermansiaceae bacterium]
MKTCLLAIALFALPAIPAMAQDRAEPHPIIGLWQPVNMGKGAYEDEGHFHYEFRPNGDYWRFDSGDMGLHVQGSWTLDQESGHIHMKSKTSRGEYSFVLVPEFDGEDKLALIDEEGKKAAYTRTKGNLDASKLVGIWRGEEIGDEENPSEHAITVRNDDGSGVAKSITFNHKAKVYCVTETPIQWWVSGGYLVTVHDSEPYLTVPRLVTKDKLEHDYAFYQEGHFTAREFRAKDDKLPMPPEDYKKLSEEKFWEPFMEEVTETFVWDEETQSWRLEKEEVKKAGE